MCAACQRIYAVIIPVNHRNLFIPHFQGYFLALNILMMIMTFSQFVITNVAAALCCGAVCCTPEVKLTQ